MSTSGGRRFLVVVWSIAAKTIQSGERERDGRSSKQGLARAKNRKQEVSCVARLPIRSYNAKDCSTKWNSGKFVYEACMCVFAREHTHAHTHRIHTLCVSFRSFAIILWQKKKPKISCTIESSFFSLWVVLLAFITHRDKWAIAQLLLNRGAKNFPFSFFNTTAFFLTLTCFFCSASLGNTWETFWCFWRIYSRATKL